MPLIVLYFLHSTSVLLFYIDVVLTLSIRIILCMLPTNDRRRYTGTPISIALTLSTSPLMVWWINTNKTIIFSEKKMKKSGIWWWYQLRRCMVTRWWQRLSILIWMIPVKHLWCYSVSVMLLEMVKCEYFVCTWGGWQLYRQNVGFKIIRCKCISRKG